jgi:hypothetical protein
MNLQHLNIHLHFHMVQNHTEILKHFFTILIKELQRVSINSNVQQIRCCNRTYFLTSFSFITRRTFTLEWISNIWTFSSVKTWFRITWRFYRKVFLINKISDVPVLLMRHDYYLQRIQNKHLCFKKQKV